ncbi:MAG: spore germination protein [Candidatus Paraimprobicoccus trichonymphae]|uniref:Spore germination protein n=1 Tax=Candidatus Paraimprobicoccus trichonymphae TaxID=3033793 RepID=A0AA48I5M8_9FIRM|nr:MAG: spore germination protein [Candidatus Paraimprobicoccus trichonymphae]
MCEMVYLDNNSKIISSVLKENILRMKKDFGETADFVLREIKISEIDAAVVSLDGMTNRDLVIQSVLNRICNINIPGTASEKYEYIKSGIITATEHIESDDYDQILNMLMAGFTILALDKVKFMLILSSPGYSCRSIAEPSSEIMQRDSREGFIEVANINITLLRRRFKTPKLMFESISFGSVSKTLGYLCYLTDKVSQSVLNEVRRKLKKVNLETVLASGYLTPYLEEENDLSLFSSVGMSERPDTVAGKIAEGRIAILIDGTPNVLIIPYLFVEYFQSLDDYSMKPYFASFIRWVKYIAFFVSVLLPSLYVGLATFNPEVFPSQLLSKIALAVGTTPFSLVLETTIILFMYEIMREAGLRLPKPVGHAVSIVGGLVIGQTAVTSGLIGSPTLMVVALTAICSYVIPALYESMAFLRLILIIVAGFTGVWGTVLVFCAVLINICSKTNYGIPFTAPISPFSLLGMRDVLIRAGWKFLSKKENTVQKMPGSNI